MPAGFLTRNDVSDSVRRPNPRGIYAVKYLEDSDPLVLEDAIDSYLLALPRATNDWSPHLISTDFGYKEAGGSAVHFCWLTLYAVGTITTTPIG